MTFPAWTDLKAVRLSTREAGLGVSLTVSPVLLASGPQPFRPVLRGEAALMWTMRNASFPNPVLGPEQELSSLVL